MGRAIDKLNERAPGYLFAETMAFRIGKQKIAINLNPKLAWSGIGSFGELA